VVGDDRALLGEALDVLGLLLEERQRDEQREVRVDVAGVLEHAVEDPLHVLPQRVAPRLDHHAAAHRRVLGQVGGLDDLLVPLGVVVGAGGDDGGGGFGGRHDRTLVPRRPPRRKAPATPVARGGHTRYR
jgi:hypothetical protein